MTRRAPKARGGATRKHLVLALLQLAAILCFVFGDIGFDRPGRFGLDFDDALLILGFFAVMWMWGTLLAFRRRAWNWALVQLALPVLGTFAAWVMEV